MENLDNKIKEIFYVFKSLLNDKEARVLIYSHVDFNSIEAWGNINKLSKPTMQIGVSVIYKSDKEVFINTSGSVDVLPNREDLIIIFPDKETKFFMPNNAAICNSDGSLRHQLIVPEELMNQGKIGKEGWYIHSTYYADFPRLKGFGVMVTNDYHWPELCFCLYDGTPNLVWTKYKQERR